MITRIDLGIFCICRVMIGFTVGFIFIINLVVTVGFILYANYHDCDPIATKVKSYKICLDR